MCCPVLTFLQFVYEKLSGAVNAVGGAQPWHEGFLPCLQTTSALFHIQLPEHLLARVSTLWSVDRLPCQLDHRSLEVY